MVKARTAEQEAIRAAQRRPEKKWFANRRMAWGFFEGWSFFTDWTSMSVSVGQVGGRAEKETAPMPVFLFSFGITPIYASMFWRNKHIFWIGDWEWKRGLRASPKRPL